MSLSFGVYLELICLAAALLCLLKVKDSAWRGMIFYLAITCLAEIIGYILKRAHQHNPWVYNIQLLAEATFNSILFGRILKQYINSRPLIISGLALTFTVYLFDLLQHGFLVFNDLTLTVMSVVFVIYSFYYYFLLIKDEQYTNLANNAAFWWVTGSLFYYFGGTASNLFYGFLNNVKFGQLYLSPAISLALSVTLYSCWIYSFICKRWLQPSSGI